MAAIITDQLRISNANDFLKKVRENQSSYYIFMGLSNSEQISENWDSFPPPPKDSFDEENSYWNSIFSLKRVNPGDVRQMVRKIEWNSGDVYDMYRHDIQRDLSPRDKRSKPSNSPTLYLSNYYVVNKDYKVYICLHNGASPENNFLGTPSFDEPTFTTYEPSPAGTSGDGYIWKYLFTISPSDIVKFDSTDYIPVPVNWGIEGESVLVKNHAKDSSQIKICTIRNRGRGLEPGLIQNVPLVGDGTGGEVSINIGNDSRVESIQVTNGGFGYTFASVDWKSSGIVAQIEDPQFDVIIPPKGGHGFDIYRELGAYYVLIYSRFENDTDNRKFILGNKISRIGLVENPLVFNADQTLGQSNINSASAVYALKLRGISSNTDDFKIARFLPNSIITQQIGTTEFAVGRVISYDQETGVLKYWQDRSLFGFNYDGSIDFEPEYGFKLNRFSNFVTGTGNLIVKGGSIDLEIDTDFGSDQFPASVLNNINLGQSFIRGISFPEVQPFSGNILYVDNRPSILRSVNQKEDIKIVLQF